MRNGRCVVTALLSVVVTIAGGGFAAAQDGPPALERPKYQTLRFLEDWSVLRDAPPEALADPWDAIKYVPLSADGTVWASFGGHTRARLEGWSNFSFGAPADADDAFVLWRLLLHADIHAGENVRFFVEGKSAQSTERSLPGGRRTADVDTLALQQAFADLTLPLGDAGSITIRPGRQELLFGAQRLVSPLPWANTMRAWDGVSAILSCGDWNLHGFWTQFAPVQKYRFNDADPDIQFSGIYATGHVPSTDIGMDLYWLWLDRATSTFNGTTGGEDRHTLGGRLWGTCGDSGFDADVEGAWQFGEVGAGDISAFMIGSELGYQPPGVAGAPRFHLGVDFASGDETAGGDVETFNQLFPLGHAYLGYMDFVGRQNVIDLSPGMTIHPAEQVTLRVAGHFFWRAETSDALYNAGGSVVRAGSLGTARDVGTEIDVTAKVTLSRHLAALFGYSHFFAGDFISQSGAADDMDFAYVQMTFTF